MERVVVMEDPVCQKIGKIDWTVMATKLLEIGEMCLGELLPLSHRCSNLLPSPLILWIERSPRDIS